MVLHLSDSSLTTESNPSDSGCGCPLGGAERSTNNEASDLSRIATLQDTTANVTALSDPASDKYYINALIESGTPRWNAGSPLGTPVTLTYDFMTAIPNYYTVAPNGVIQEVEGVGFSAISDALRQQQIRVALNRWSDVANITFVPASGGNGQIRFGMTNLPDDAVGLAFPPTSISDPISGDIWLDNESGSRNDSFALGTFGFQTILHELGHALGLKHPFDTPGVTLPEAEDSYQYTNMSYDYHPDMGGTANPVEPTTALLYDIAAIQYLYGANTSTRAGNTNYTWATNSAFIEAIWDGGGVDTIDASNQIRPVDINLVAGQFSSIGAQRNNAGDAVNNLAIAYGVTIENAIGGSGDDFITGNQVDNILKGAGGDDTLDGGLGADTLYGQNGDDTYIVDNVGDLIIEYDSNNNDTGGIDSIESSIDFDLRNVRYVEGLALAGTAIQGIGNQLNNFIYGNELNNRLEGGDGNDTLDGGAGNDTLTGGAGADYFTFDTGTAFTNEIGVDRITDFLAGTDLIVLDKATFATLSSTAGGTLHPNEFATINDVVNGATLAGASVARIVFNQFNGDLFYNPDAALAGLGFGGRFATLAGVTSLAASNFAIQA